MIVRSIDADGDWNFGKGRNDYLVNIDAISQSIKTRLQSYLGDCFFATTAGVDWFNLIGSKNRLGLELAVRSVILNTPGVSRLIDVSINLSNNRNILMKYTVETVYSSALVTGEIVSNSFLLLTEDGNVLTTEDGNAIELG